MAAEIADVPRRRRAAARDLGRNVDDRDERQLHAAERLRLMEAKQPGLVQQLLVLADEHARVLGSLRALAQHGHDLARAAHRLVVADGGEIAAGRLRQRADFAERSRGIHGTSPSHVALAQAEFAPFAVRAGQGQYSEWSGFDIRYGRERHVRHPSRHGDFGPRRPQSRFLHPRARAAAGQEDRQFRRSRHLSPLLWRRAGPARHDPDLLSVGARGAGRISASARRRRRRSAFRQARSATGRTGCWRRASTHEAPEKRFGESVLTFRDPDGMRFALVGVAGAESEEALGRWRHSGRACDPRLSWRDVAA